MLSAIKMLATIALSLKIVWSVAGLPQNLSQRDISSNSLSDYRGALFVVANTQTSCEMALIDSSAGFVAASCLTYKSNGNVDNGIDYRVAINGIGNDESKVNSVTMVDVHPNYNPSTYANNIAVLHWGNPKEISWHQDIGQDRTGWDSTFYTRRTMSSVSDALWSTPAVLTLSGSDAISGCSSASNLYSSNKDWFLCIAQTTTSITNGNCQTPYGAVWGAYQSDTVAVAAIYSHSSIYDGSELCGSTGNQYHYYTMLQPYVDWASKMTGRKVYTYAADSSYSYKGSSSFNMDNDLAPAVFGVTTVSGDLYPSAKEYKGPSGSSSNNNNFANGSGTTTTLPTENNSNTDDNTDMGANSALSSDKDDEDNENNKNDDNPDASDNLNVSENPTESGNNNSDSDKSINDGKTDDTENANIKDDMKNGSDSSSSSDDSGKSGYGGISRGAIIAISTIVPIATIIILVCLFFAYKWWKKRRNFRNWDPKNETSNIDCIRIIDNIGELGSTRTTIENRIESIRASCPPAYIEHEFGAISTRTSKMPM